MPERLTERDRTIETYTHDTEPPGVWTSRGSTSQWGDAVPLIQQID